MQICAFLRWKGRHPEDDSRVLSSQFLRNPVQYRCLLTCQPWGVDGNPAVPEICGPERACYRSSKARARGEDPGRDRDDNTASGER